MFRAITQLLTCCRVASSLSILLLGTTPVHAQGPGEWDVDLTVYAWAAGLDGTLAAGQREAPIEVTAKELLEALDFAFMTGVSATSKKWIIDGVFDFADLGKEVELVTVQTFPGVDPNVSLDAQQSIVSGSVGYRVTDNIDVLGGVRGYYLSSSLDANVGRLASTSAGWVDPIVGARYRRSLGDKWRVGLRGDVGGFGAGSEFAWYINAFASRQFTDLLALTFGYRLWDFEREGGEDILEFDATLAGGAIGLTLSF